MYQQMAKHAYALHCQASGLDFKSLGVRIDCEDTYSQRLEHGLQHDYFFIVWHKYRNTESSTKRFIGKKLFKIEATDAGSTVDAGQLCKDNSSINATQQAVTRNVDQRETRKACANADIVNGHVHRLAVVRILLANQQGWIGIQETYEVAQYNSWRMLSAKSHEPYGVFHWYDWNPITNHIAWSYSNKPSPYT